MRITRDEGARFESASRDAGSITYVVEDWRMTFEILVKKSGAYKAKLRTAQKLESRACYAPGDVPRVTYLRGRRKALSYYAAYRHRMEAIDRLDEQREVQLRLAL